MIFCPSCFVKDNILSEVKIEGGERKCPKCGIKYGLNDTLISEDTVRTYCAAAPRSTKDMLNQLEEMIRNR